MEKLSENQTYTLYNGEIHDNYFPLKVCQNKLKFLSNGGTMVSNTYILDISSRQFIFKEITYLINGKFTRDNLYGNVIFYANYYLLSLS